jgi:hypothetical protein
METISGCRHLKVNLKAKIYIYVNSTTQRCPNKMIKNFLIEIFSICHRCQRHWWCTLSHEYLREFSKKFEIALMVYSGAWGKLIHGFLKNRTGNFIKFDLDTSIGHENLKYSRDLHKKVFVC